jgi:amidase
MDDLATLDATAQAELVSSGEASPSELVEAAIARIEAVNPELNAVIHPLFDEAREAAQGGLPEGPFKGVPMLLKDLGPALAGAPLHMGMRYLKERDFRGPVNSFLFQKFSQAGFVFVGKTNVPELGIPPTTEPVAYGSTLNPWDTSRTPHGSSGGSAAAVAAGMVPLAHANDGGGSIRIPASANGLVGLKPTRQRISQGPLTGDFAGGLGHEGVVTHSVRDTAAVLDAVHGYMPGDPYDAPAPERRYLEEVGADPGKLKIGLWTEPTIDVEPDPDVLDAARDAGELLESLGHSVEPLDVSPLRAMAGYESFKVRYGAGFAALLDQLGVIGGSEIGPDDVEPITWALAEYGRRHSAGEYLAAVNNHQAMIRMSAGIILGGGFDLVLSPTMGEPPVPLGTYDDSGPEPLDAFDRARVTGCFTGPANVGGEPAISLPLHWNDDGLPIGVQLAAPFGREDLLIRVAAQLEQARPWNERHPGVWAGDPVTGAA